MTLVLITLAISVGITSAVQVAMLGGITRLRGGFEATWISLSASLAGIAAVILVSALLGREPLLTNPFDRPIVYGMFLGLMAAAVILASRGLPPYLALTGLLPIPYLLAAAFIGPRIGLAVFLGAVIAGQLIGGLLLDHIGAFGAEPRPVDPMRIVGALVLVVGVVLIRGRQ